MNGARVGLVRREIGSRSKIVATVEAFVSLCVDRSTETGRSVVGFGRFFCARRGRYSAYLLAGKEIVALMSSSATFFSALHGFRQGSAALFEKIGRTNPNVCPRN